MQTIIPRDAGEVEARRSSGLLAGRRADVVSLAMGALFPLAFAPYGYGLIAYPVLAVFFLTCLNASATRAAWRGWLFGVGQFTVGCGWVYTGLQYGGGAVGAVPLLLAVFLVSVFLVGVQALYPALAAFVSAGLYARRPHTMLLVAFPLTWALAEYARSIVWIGFPRLLAGYSQIDTPLAGYAPLLGVIGTGMITALVGGLLGSLLLRRQNYLARLMGITGLFLFGSLVLEISWTDPQGDPIKVSLLQGNAVQDEKWSNHSRAEQMNWYQAQTREHWNSDLIVWPETSVADTPANVEFLLANLRARSIRDAKDVIVGVAEGDFTKGRYFNSLVNLRVGVYHKRWLIPLAEYFPWPSARAWLAGVLRLQTSDARRGEDEQPLLEGAGHKLGASISYEISYSDEVRRALPAAAVLVNSGNDAAFRRSSLPYQHHEIARFRALETGRYLIRAVNTGISAVIGSKGEVVASARVGEETVVTAKVQPLQGSTPYVWLGDTPLVVVGLGFLVLLVLDRAAHRRKGVAE